MPRKLPKIDSAMMDDLFAPTEGKKRKPTRYDEENPRHSYRTPEALHQALKEIAAGLDVGLNELVRYVHRDFIARYKAGEVTVPIEEYTTTRTIVSGESHDR